MQKVNLEEMESFHGGRQADCLITAGLTVVGGALGFLALTTVTAGFGLAAAAFGVSYLRGMYATVKACKI